MSKFFSSLVLTTINDPIVLDGYLQNFDTYSHLDQVEIIVIPDKKTPPQVYERCKLLNKNGIRSICPSLNDQEDFLKRIGFPSELIPYNSDNRRNIGYLMALESGNDFLISIDDDNYCPNLEDFFENHSCVMIDQSFVNTLDSSNGWYNVCNLLNVERPGTTYPRGYPYYARHKLSQTEIKLNQINIHVNMGLWTKDPDLDGITWLVAPSKSLSFVGESIVLGKNTWSPVNTQNTSLRRAAIPAYYFVKMGYPINGMPIDRYGDIFSGYFIQACMRHLGGSMRVGTPIAEHQRNCHVYMKDAYYEFACVMVLEDLLEWLTELKLEGNSYIETYISLSYFLEEFVEKINGTIWTDSTRGYFHQMAYYMRKWSNVCKNIL